MLEREDACRVCQEPATHWCPKCGMAFCDKLWVGVFVPYDCARCRIR